MDYRLNKIINIIRNLNEEMMAAGNAGFSSACLLYTSPRPRDGLLSRMQSSA